MPLVFAANPRKKKRAVKKTAKKAIRRRVKKTVVKKNPASKFVIQAITNDFKVYFYTGNGKRWSDEYPDAHKYPNKADAVSVAEHLIDRGSVPKNTKGLRIAK